ncbi:MAG: glutamate 5-kinase [Candidatus Omnitrophica bacterium]|nr:glutamate 5-kinase [Candidatus Omnitrophota bacterium]
MQSQRNYKRVVIKIGSSLFATQKSRLDMSLVNNIAGQISDLVKQGKEIVIVSSGAIALGMSILKLANRPKELQYLQAAAAIGQHELMHVYNQAFKEYGLNAAQLLLTWDDFSSRLRYLNAKNTLNTLLKLKCVPVINENDTVSTEEIKFGDNDKLSALASVLVGAELLIILSDVDGLLDGNKKVVRLVDKITGQIKSLACPTSKKTCVGGMVTKIEAARIAVDSGIACVIANGHSKGIINQIAHDPFSHGTIFLPKQTILDEKKRWMAFGTKSKGRIVVDDGARKALCEKKSLLAVGVVSCDGNFYAGDVVSVCDKKNHEIGRGKVGLASRELERVKGERFPREVIHRDHLVIL